MAQFVRFAIWSVGILALLFAFVSFAPSGAQARKERCHVVADKPKLVTTRSGNRVIVGQGRRAGPCPARKLLVVELRQDRTLWPDKLLDRAEFRVFAGPVLKVSYPCTGAGGKTVFVEAWTDDDSDQSARIDVSACQ
jgi:hypothetical protein